MKKLLSVVLALTLVLSMGTTAFAAETAYTEATSSASADVNGYVSSESGKPVYKVLISWGEFTYVYTGQKEWNNSTNKWVTTSDSGWRISTPNQDLIVVGNQSSVSMDVGFDFLSNGKVNNLVGSFVKDHTMAGGYQAADWNGVTRTLTMAAPVDGQAMYGEAFRLELNSDPVDSLTEQKIGDLTLTIQPTA